MPPVDRGPFLFCFLAVIKLCFSFILGHDLGSATGNHEVCFQSSPLQMQENMEEDEVAADKIRVYRSLPWLAGASNADSAANL